MNQITLESVEDYMQSLLPPRDPVVAEMEDFAKKNRVPIVGPMVGRFCPSLRASLMRAAFSKWAQLSATPQSGLRAL